MVSEPLGAMETLPFPSFLTATEKPLPADATAGSESVHAPEHVSAAALASLAAEQLARGETLPAPRPLYLRRPDAQVPKNYKVVTPK